MKICSKCKTEHDNAHPYCKPCRKEYDRSYHARPDIKLSRVERGRKVKADNRQRLWDYFLAHPCVDCGEVDPVVLEFDHRGEEPKSFGIAEMMHCTWRTILAEILKCDVRCANCHRRRTYKQFGSWRVANALVAQR